MNGQACHDRLQWLEWLSVAAGGVPQGSQPAWLINNSVWRLVTASRRLRRTLVARSGGVLAIIRIWSPNHKSRHFYPTASHSCSARLLALMPSPPTAAQLTAGGPVGSITLVAATCSPSHHRPCWYQTDRLICTEAKPSSLFGWHTSLGQSFSKLTNRSRRLSSDRPLDRASLASTIR